MAGKECVVRIVMTGHGRGEVFIDGQKIERVRGFSFMCDTYDRNRLLIDIVADRVEIDGVADVTNIESTTRVFEAGSSDGR